MERRKFVGLGAGVSLAAVLVPRAVAGIGTLVPKGVASIKSDKTIQGRISTISGDVRI